MIDTLQKQRQTESEAPVKPTKSGRASVHFLCKTNPIETWVERSRFFHWSPKRHLHFMRQDCRFNSRWGIQEQPSITSQVCSNDRVGSHSENNSNPNLHKDYIAQLNVIITLVMVLWFFVQLGSVNVNFKWLLYKEALWEYRWRVMYSSFCFYTKGIHLLPTHTVMHQNCLTFKTSTYTAAMLLTKKNKQKKPPKL